VTSEAAFSDRPATLAEYVTILRRRKWIIIALPVMAALIAYAVTTSQAPLFKAKAQVWFDRSNASSVSTGTADPAAGDPERFLRTQAKVAASPELARRVADAAEARRIDASQFGSNASAGPLNNVDILELSVSAPTPADAQELTNIYADEFTRYKTQLDRASINDSLRTIDLKVKNLERRGATDTPRYDKLVERQIDLETAGEELAKNARVLQPAEGAAKVRPLPRRNAIIGGLLGFLLGLALAFLAEALDKRVRTEQEIEETLGLPLLGRLPRPPRSLRKSNQLVMIAEPQSVHAQVFRKLRTTLEFVNFERGARTILITSAVPREGKSTTVANLAVALARAGRRVALVDLDLRRPLLHTFFRINGPGLTDVVVKRIDLARALRSIALPSSDSGTPMELPPSRALTDPGNGVAATAYAATTSNGRAKTDGVLHLLPAGTIPPAADEFLESDRVATLLNDLSGQFDIVLVDAPPLLAVADAQTLSASVDAMVVVTQLGIHRRQLLEFSRQLRNCRAAILGFVLAGATHGDSYTYGYGYDPHVYADRHKAEQQPESVQRQP
jgi:Mrp family chromosome partitioning ATPase